MNHSGSKTAINTLRTYCARLIHGSPTHLWLAGAAFAFLVFFRITRELIEGDVNGIDLRVLRTVTAWRTPSLTAAMVDVTALGSVTIAVLFSAVAFLILIVLRNRLGALQLSLASIGAALLTIATKDMIERARPAGAQSLIVVSGFSYPSGHSLGTCALYLTLAIIACRHVPYPRARTAIFITASLLVLLVGASRIYLGVHYMTDVVSGISLGATWALLLAAVFPQVRAKT